MNRKDMKLLLPIITVILAVVSYLVCSNIFIPEITDNMARIDAANQDIINVNQKLDSILAADKSMTELSELVNNLLIAVPEGINSPDLITEIEAIANQNQVILPSLSPPTALNSSPSLGGASETGLTTNLTVTGSFQNITNFINSLETSIRFSKINNLTIASSDSGLSAAINFNVYSRPTVSGSAEVAK